MKWIEIDWNWLRLWIDWQSAKHCWYMYASGISWIVNFVVWLRTVDKNQNLKIKDFVTRVLWCHKVQEFYWNHLKRGWIYGSISHLMWSLHDNSKDICLLCRCTASLLDKVWKMHFSKSKLSIPGILFKKQSRWLRVL